MVTNSRFMHTLAGLLSETIGLDSESIGMPAIAQSIELRMKSCRIDVPNEYLYRVRESEEEMAALINEVTVGETWFFREPSAFSVLREYARRTLQAGDDARPLRIASLPCSSGEEPYSIAMTLLETGLVASQFTIDAVDINGEVLEVARRAHYGKNSFRGVVPEFSQQYFEQRENRVHIDDRVVKTVSFHQANLLFLDFDFLQHRYDIIFCRNFLIYLDGVARERVLESLKRGLALKGTLIVGQCEASLVSLQGFDLLNDRCNCTYHKAPATHSLAGRRKGGDRRQGLREREDRRQSSSRFLKPASTGDTGVNAGASLEPQERLSHLEAMANSGHLAEAELGCEAFLKEHPDNVDGCFLLGLVKEAGGDWSASIKYFRKVLYLQPDHQDALLHCAAVYEHRGELAKAKSFRTRLSRVLG